ncbi:MAG TPA: L-arabinose isomerase [Saprospiraceae bacterium]|nr:L-arabinose isomerase [Saprospiraceae bacterium]
MAQTNPPYEIWFITGSQTLYGDETLKKVAENSAQIVNYLNEKGLPIQLVVKPTAKSTEEISGLCKDANYHKNCIGIITWMHTFSPAKMWISGLKNLRVPLLHLHTQFNRDIPFDSIDMDFMNLNQSAHGDREFAHILTRMKIHRKIVVGHYQSESVISKIQDWMRLCIGKDAIQNLKVARFGDNMRYVSVTEGDKVAAEMQFGFSVNTYGVGDLVANIQAISEQDILDLVRIYEETYFVSTTLQANGQKRIALLEAARIELGIKSFLTTHGCHAYTNTFEDLHGLSQLPGIASQRLMADGYGFGAEGDWKTSAILHVMKKMAYGLSGGNSFMEDYTYHFEPDGEMVLGSHMLEICPSIADENIQCEVHPLGIGGKADPVRLVFNAKEGPAINISLVDLGNRFRLIIQKVEGLKVHQEFPLLPTARALWKPLPNMEIGLEAWLLSGGAHHTVYSQNLSAELMADFGEMLGIETIVIDEKTDIQSLKQTLKINEIYYR